MCCSVHFAKDSEDGGSLALWTRSLNLVFLHDMKGQISRPRCHSGSSIVAFSFGVVFHLIAVHGAT